MDIITLTGYVVTYIYIDIIPVIFSLAFFFFIWNAFRFFIWKGATEEGREKARRLMVWGILALVVIVGLWGIITIIHGLFGIDPEAAPVKPDYII